MILALVMGISMLCGVIGAEIWYRIDGRKRKNCQRKALIVEFFDRQLWQFVSIDEWLEANLRRSRFD